MGAEEGVEGGKVLAAREAEEERALLAGVEGILMEDEEENGILLGQRHGIS